MARGAPDHAEHFVSQGGHGGFGVRLDVEPEQRLGVGRPHVEPPVPVLTVSPSSSSVLTPGRPAKACLTRSVAAAWSATSELISPLAKYLVYAASSWDSGCGCSPSAASVCSAASSPESAYQKSLK